MKIIAILSSPKGKHSNTLRLVEAALEGAREAGAETEAIDVARLKIKYCKGCTACYRDGACHQRDDYGALRNRILEADGIVLSSPNYIDNVTAQFKAFLDRSANFIHEQYLDGKYGLSLATSGSGNDGPVLDVLDRFIGVSGGLVVGRVGCGMGQGPEAFEAAVRRSREAGMELARAIAEKRAYPDQMAAHQAWKKHFAMTVERNRDLWPHNYELWAARGWIRGGG